jgi:GTP pyrophosphokinase
VGVFENQKGFDWLQQLLEWQQDLEDPNDFLTTVKVDLFANEVYVFTPGGDVHAFPRGVTPLDFAYAIHTDLGHECTGANINGSQVNLKTELQNGDVVTIQRTKGNRPKAAWIKCVKTGRAATKIRAFLRQEENERAAISGQELLEKELKRLGLGLGRVRKEGWISDVLEKMKFKNEREIFVNLGYGKIRLEHCIEHMLPEERRGTDKPETKENVFQRFVRNVLPKSKGGIIVDGLDGLAIKFPKCCSPVKGDLIFGFVSRGQGVMIHRSDCARVLDYDPARRVQVQWDSDSRELRPILLRIHSGDVPGLLANVSQSFHNAGVNITAVNCRLVGHDKAINNFTVMIKDLEQLNRVVSKIEKLKGVRMVERVDDPV